MLLSRMSESGNLGSHAQAYAEQLKYQEKLINESTAKGGSPDDGSKSSDGSELSSFEVKLKDGKTSSGHKNNLSETFDDVLNIRSGNTPPAEEDMPKISPPGSDNGTKYSTFTAPDAETEVVPAKDVEPKNRFANPDHLSFEPPAHPGVTSTVVQNNAYYPPHGMQYPGYYAPHAGEHSYHQYSYPPQGYRYSSNEHAAPAAGYPVPPPPPVLTPSSTDSRKHRREISEHHPMAHRRKNTYGESESTKWSYADRDNEVDIMAPIQDNQYQASPNSDSPPAVDHPVYAPQGYPPMPYGYYAPSISSAHSDSGASYNTGSSAPALPPYYGQSHSLRASPNPGPFYYGQQQHYPNEGYHGFDSYTTSLKSGDNDSHYSDSHHRKQSSLSAFLAMTDSDSHHRKQSSLGAFLATTGIFEDVFNEMEDKGYDSAPENIEENAIQATTEPIVQGSADLSSSLLSKNLSDDAFFQQFYKAIHEDDDAPVAAPAPRSYSADNATSISCLPVGFQPQPNTLAPNPSKLVLKKQSSAGEANRHRRKCAVETCPNRVVQGGLCIAHGAKRKTCNFPGCTKNVKKQGKCSAHGPERKRCEAEGCVKVAVQGGKCISHGAKKKGCGIEGCTKQSIMGGMCKKHYDEYREYTIHCTCLRINLDCISAN